MHKPGNCTEYNKPYGVLVDAAQKLLSFDAAAPELGELGEDFAVEIRLCWYDAAGKCGKQKRWCSDI